MSTGDDISRELEAMSSNADVEAELAALKGATGAPAIESSTPPAATEPVAQAEKEEQS